VKGKIDFSQIVGQPGQLRVESRVATPPPFRLHNRAKSSIESESGERNVPPDLRYWTFEEGR